VGRVGTSFALKLSGDVSHVQKEVVHDEQQNGSFSIVLRGCNGQRLRHVVGSR
jgi:hypothetical protein